MQCDTCGKELKLKLVIKDGIKNYFLKCDCGEEAVPAPVRPDLSSEERIIKA